MSEAKPTIVVRRKKIHLTRAHNSAWKIAFADFATAMMAFFLVLWLTEATSLEEQRAISSYFTDPIGFNEGGFKSIIDLGGRGDDRPIDPGFVESIEQAQKIIDAQTIQQMAFELEQQQFEQLAKQIRDMIAENQALGEYLNQVEVTVTPEGLQIQILDQDNQPMFDKGSDELRPHVIQILKALALTLKGLSNRLSISGHTDASAYIGRDNYSNWELSSERANAARRVLQSSGVGQEQIARVVGMGSSKLYRPDDPLSPVNRRISILVLSKEPPEQLKNEPQLQRQSQPQSQAKRQDQSQLAGYQEPISKALTVKSSVRPSLQDQANENHSPKLDQKNEKETLNNMTLKIQGVPRHSQPSQPAELNIFDPDSIESNSVEIESMVIKGSEAAIEKFLGADGTLSLEAEVTEVRQIKLEPGEALERGQAPPNQFKASQAAVAGDDQAEPIKTDSLSSPGQHSPKQDSSNNRAQDNGKASWWEQQ